MTNSVWLSATYTLTSNLMIQLEELNQCVGHIQLLKQKSDVTHCYDKLKNLFVVCK